VDRWQIRGNPEDKKDVSFDSTLANVTLVNSLQRDSHGSDGERPAQKS